MSDCSDGMVQDVEEVNSLIYIGAVFKEAMRIKTVIPFLDFTNNVRLCSAEELDGVLQRSWAI